MELGCFLAGALLSTQGHMVTTDVLGCIEPIRDFLAIIFFASIGQARFNDVWLTAELSACCTLISLPFVCVCVFLRRCCRFSRVPHIRALRTHHPAGAHALSGDYEGTALLTFPGSPFARSPLLTRLSFRPLPSQFMMAVLVLSVILPAGLRHIRWVVSAGLAQVSEFSFVLSSRARRAGIISREVSDE